MDDTTALLADIRRYEEILARDPASFCFAPLSDVYRRMGRLDEALEIAIKGCETHPTYIAGYMALGRACFEKGLHAEARQALAKVIAVIPENQLAHSLLSQIDTAVASTSRQGKEEPEPIIPVISEAGPVSDDFTFGINEVASGAEDDILDLTEEIIELGDELAEEPDECTQCPEIEEEPDAAFSAPDTRIIAPSVSPLSTATIADLYLAQGFPDRALGIYRELLATDPSNEDLRKKVEQLSTMREEGTAGADVAGAAITPTVAEPCPGPPDEATVLATLEGWLENIRRAR